MKIIGHRGSMGTEPENTLRSFRAALEAGADMIELDVYALPSGQVVVIHDDSLDRTTNGHGSVKGANFDELRKLDAGKGEKIPTLDEVIDLVDRKVPINIELKGPDTAEPVTKSLKKYLAEGWMNDDFIISSFRHDELGRFKKLNPDIAVSVLLSRQQWLELARNTDKAVRLAQSLDAAAINPNLKFVNAELIKKARAAGLEINVFTIVNDVDVLRMERLGADAVFCNFPARAKEVLATRL